MLKVRLDHKGSSDYILRGFSKGCLLLGTSPKCAWYVFFDPLFIIYFNLVNV